MKRTFEPVFRWCRNDAPTETLIKECWSYYGNDYLVPLSKDRKERAYVINETSLPYIFINSLLCTLIVFFIPAVCFVVAEQGEAVWAMFLSLVVLAVFLTTAVPYADYKGKISRAEKEFRYMIKYSALSRYTTNDISTKGHYVARYIFLDDFKVDTHGRVLLKAVRAEDESPFVINEDEDICVVDFFYEYVRDNRKGKLLEREELRKKLCVAVLEEYPDLTIKENIAEEK